MPQSFFYREKEGNVWAPCLLLGLSSDGFNHPWVPSSSSPWSPSFLLLLWVLFHLIFCFLSSFRGVPAMLVFNLCLCVQEWVGSAPVEKSVQYHAESVWAPLFSAICLWWTWMSRLVCKLLSFGWTPIPLTWMHFYIVYIDISSSHLVWSCVSAVLCWTGRLFFFSSLCHQLKWRSICRQSYWMRKTGKGVRI